MTHMRLLRLGTLAPALIALVLLCALPAVAWGQGGSPDQSGENDIDTGSGDTSADVDGEQDAEIDSGDNSQNAIQQCIAGRDCNQQINQNQTINQTTTAAPAAAPAPAPTVVRPTVVEKPAPAPAPAPVAVREVALAETGFDAWLLGLLGLGAIGGGAALLVAQRRGGLGSLLRR